MRCAVFHHISLSTGRMSTAETRRWTSEENRLRALGLARKSCGHGRASPLGVALGPDQKEYVFRSPLVVAPRRGIASEHDEACPEWPRVRLRKFRETQKKKDLVRRGCFSSSPSNTGSLRFHDAWVSGEAEGQRLDAPCYVYFSEGG